MYFGFQFLILDAKIYLEINGKNEATSVSRSGSEKELCFKIYMHNTVCASF